MITQLRFFRTYYKSSVLSIIHFASEQGLEERSQRGSPVMEFYRLHKLRTLRKL